MRISIHLVLFALISTSVSAQTKFGSVAGVITDAQGEPIPGITAMLDGTGKGAIADGNGKYEIEGIKPGSYQLLISGVGYAKQSHSVIIKSGQRLKLIIQLIEDTQQLNEVIVRGQSEAQQLEMTAKAVKAIETIEVKLKTADLGEVIARVEGVSVQRAGGLGSNTRFSLNGLTGDQVRFFLDGIPLEYSPYSFGMANVPVNSIERLEIYKGVVPIEFGADALGGAVNLVTPDVPEGVSGAASYQVGSFGTHRLTTNLKYLDPSSGWFVDAGGFYDYADNNYKVDVEVPNELGQLREVTVPRFHDTYRAYGINVASGIRSKKWADELSMNVFFADYEKDIQHNQVMSGIPFGEVKSFNTSKGINLVYRNKFGDNIAIESLSGFNTTERVFLDTSRYVYNWLGDRLRESDGGFTVTQPGEIGQASHQFAWDDNYFARLNTSYQISGHHSLKLTLAPSYTLRTGDELLAGIFDPLTDEGRLLTVVNGLEYTFNSSDNKLQNILFGKRYDQRLKTKRAISDGTGFTTNERSVNYYGYGNGIRYEFTGRISSKLTYEYAARMPRPDEVFGDGRFVVENIDLRPERSHNVNLELEYARFANQSDWNLQSNFFLRNIEDLILLIPATERRGIYLNVPDVQSLGFELSGKWEGFGNRLTIDLNTTYQRFYNNSREGPFEPFFGDRIPNQPYYFANGAANYAFQGLIRESDKLSVFWSGRYVHQFFRGWESAGTREFKLEIPQQFVNNLGATYELMWKKFRYSLTAEIQNITNTKVFDFLGVQRPGRAFYIKLTSQF